MQFKIINFQLEYFKAVSMKFFCYFENNVVKFVFRSQNNDDNNSWRLFIVNLFNLGKLVREFSGIFGKSDILQLITFIVI